MSKRKHDGREAPRVSEDEAFDAEAERLFSLSYEEMMDEARAEGIDPAEEARKSDEWLAKYERGEIEPRTEAGRRMMEGDRFEPEAKGIEALDSDAVDREVAASFVDELRAQKQPVPPAQEAGAKSPTVGARPSRAPRRWVTGLATVLALGLGVAVVSPGMLVARQDRTAPREHSMAHTVMPAVVPVPSQVLESTNAHGATPVPQVRYPQVLAALADQVQATTSAPLHAHARPNGDPLRRGAFAACDRSRWAECLRLLDGAKRTDPVGDGAERVQHERALARAGLHLPAIAGGVRLLPE